MNQLDKRTRERLKANHPGFITTLAKEIDRHHSHVSKLFNGKALSKSAYIEAALIRRINELLRIDAATAAKNPKSRKTKRQQAAQVG